MAVIPGPPRIVGNIELDFAGYVQWLTEFYKIGVLEQELLQASEQLTAQDLIEVSDLPDPASTTLATAQQTANDAFILAATNDARLDVNEANIGALASDIVTLDGRLTTAEADIVTIETDITNIESAITAIQNELATFEQGTFTISGTDTTGGPTVSQADTSYFIACIPTAESGAPAAGARDIISVSKATNSFTATLAAAPGAGTSVTFDYLLMR